MSASEVLQAWFLSDDPRTVLAAAAALAELSSGRVRRPETLNRRTGKPERDGLHCAKIFGPVEDHRCLCGKLASREFAGQSCDKCGVLCGEKKLRDERWGHIESEAALVHPVLMPRIAAALGCSVKGLKAMLAWDADLDEDGALRPYDQERQTHGIHRVVALLGARAEELTMKRVPVTPPGWRNTRNDPQDSGYMQLINRCNRLGRLLELNAPQIILDNEERMTQMALEKAYAAVRKELRARGPVVRAPATPRAEALLQAVYDDPDDDGPRRDYAEFLSSHGDPRGEFIRRQLGSARCSRTPREEGDMLRRNLDAWLAPLGDAVLPNAVFRRGFPAAVKTTTGAAERVDDPAWATVEHLDTDLAALVCSPALRSLRSLVVPYRVLLAVCEGPTVLHRVDTLQVRVPRFPPPHAEVVTRGEALPALRALTLIHGGKRGGLECGWLDGTTLASGLSRLTVTTTSESLEELSLPWWVSFHGRYPALEKIVLSFDRRLLELHLRREGGLPSLRVLFSRALVERISMGWADMARTFERVLTAIEPYELPLVEVDSAGSGWYGDDLNALHEALRRHFGPSIRLPKLW